MRRTTHFNPETDRALRCPCCGEGKLAIATFIVLENVRVWFGQPVTVTSSCRCSKHNAIVGGADDSEHLDETVYDGIEATAADIVVKDVPPSDVYDFLCSRPYANLLGIGKYDNFTHVDTRGHTARW